MIRVGRIVNVVKPAGNGRYGSQVVKLSFAGMRYEVTAYAKKLTDLEFLVELMASLLGIAIGLPIPEPVAAIGENGEVWFASIDMKYPDLSRRLNIQNNKIINTPENNALLRQLADWPAIQEAISFDEWIANDDRNVGNILYDGRDQFFLIDHNRAMRLPFAPDAPIRNELFNLKLAVTQDELSKHRLKQKLQAIVEQFDPVLPTEIAARIAAGGDLIDAGILGDIVDFLQKRVHHLTHITQQKIITMQQSL